MTRRIRTIITTIAVTLAAVVGTAAPAGAYMPNPQPLVRRTDPRPPTCCTIRRLDPFLRRVLAQPTGKFFMGYDAHGRRVCWVVRYPGDVGVLEFDVC